MADNLLQENGSLLLQENGSAIQQESAAAGDTLVVDTINNEPQNVVNPVTVISGSQYIAVDTLDDGGEVPDAVVVVANPPTHTITAGTIDDPDEVPNVIVPSTGPQLISVNSVENLNTVNDVNLNITIKPDSVNDSVDDVPNVALTFRIRPNTIIDPDTVTNIFKMVPGPISVGVDSIANDTDTVNNITIRLRIRPDSIVNQNQIPNPNFAYDQTIQVGVLVNDTNSVNDIVVIGRNEPSVIVQDEVYRPINNIVPISERSFTTDSNSVFRDLSINFIAHPLTGAATVVSNYAAINQGLRNLFLTDKYERPFSSMDIAGKIREKLFDLQYSDSDVKTDIELAIANYEPRISLIDVSVKSNLNDLEIAIKYKIKSFDKEETLSLFLERS